MSQALLDKCLISLADAFADVDSFEKYFAELQDADPSSDRFNDLLEVANMLHYLKQKISYLFNDMQDFVTSNIGSLPGPVNVDGATVEIKSGSPRKAWDHKGLISEVSRRIVDKSVDLNTGERTATPEEMIQEAMRYMGVSYWKVNNLKDLHIDADDFCEVGEPKKNLVFRRNK